MIDRIGRRRVRYAAAVLSAATAALYLLIGVGALRVVDAAFEAPDLFEFGLMAGGAFAFGALLLAATDRRPLWLMGALLQVVVLVGYVAAAETRTPAFETWGISIKVMQALLLVALTYLAVRRPETSAVGTRVAARI